MCASVRVCDLSNTCKYIHAHTHTHMHKYGHTWIIYIQFISDCRDLAELAAVLLLLLLVLFLLLCITLSYSVAIYN